MGCTSSGDSDGCYWEFLREQPTETYTQFKIRNCTTQMLLQERITQPYANTRGDRALDLATEDTMDTDKKDTCLWTILLPAQAWQILGDGQEA